MKFSPFTFLLAGGLVLTAGDLFAAEFVRYGTLKDYILVLGLYLIGMVCLMQSYKGEDIAVASTILVVINVILLSILGFVFFGEELSNVKLAGLALGFLSIFLLEYGKRRAY